MIEVAVVLALIGVLSAMVLGAMSSLRDWSRRRSLTADLYSALNLAHSRAVVRQRTQIIYIDGIAGANGTYGFFHLEDASAPPNLIYSANQLNTVITPLDPSRPSTTTPAPYALTPLDQSAATFNQFNETADAWLGAPLPFPWAALATTPGGPVNTTGGCTFCVGGFGAVGFLPDGRAIFSNGNAVGGLVVMQQTNPSSVTRVTGIAISPTGFVQLVEPK